MLTINGAAPYNAAYGRSPAISPGNAVATGEDDLGTARRVQRMREISIQAMVGGTARARIQRALNTRALPSGKSRDYKGGDLVDLPRVASSKDTGGWKKGPAKVIENTNITRGAITVRYHRDI